jgi:hypothetical protein
MMKRKSAILWLVGLIFVLAGFAAGMGLFYQTPGEPYEIVSQYGQSVLINGSGLYAYDSYDSAVQMKSNDLITLVLGLPLLAVSAWLAARGSLRGKLLLIGTLGFFLYTYTSMATNTMFNALFLVYTALMTLSLYAFILSMMEIDVPALPAAFSDKLPRGWIAGMLFAVGGFLGLAWLGRLVPPTLAGQAPETLQNLTTMVIQAMDLGLVAPLAVLAGVLLLRKNAWGYLLSSVALLKGLTMSIAVSTMGLNQLRLGTSDEVGMVAVFGALALANLVMVYFLLKNISGTQSSGSASFIPQR